MPSYVVSFEDYQPSPRYPPAEGGWVTVRIEEASDPAGEWTAIDTITLDPPERNPQHPRGRDFTTENATLAEGWYRVVWVDALGGEQATAPVQNTDATTTPSWVPTVQNVADLCPVYTRRPVDSEGEQSGGEQGVFDDTTNPTASQVQALIAVAVEEVRGRVGVDVARLERFPELARRTAAWHAAASIEADKRPENAVETTGAYQWKYSSYVACLNSLIKWAAVPLVG